MFRFPILQTRDKNIFETTLEPTTPAVDKLSKRKDIGEGEITMLEGRKIKLLLVCFIMKT